MHSAHYLHTCFSLILISSPRTVQPLGYRPDELWIRIQFQAGVWRHTFLFSTGARPALDLTQPPNQWVLEALSPGIKHPEHEPDHLTPSSTKAKKAQSYAFIASRVFYSAKINYPEEELHIMIIHNFIKCLNSQLLSHRELVNQVVIQCMTVILASSGTRCTVDTYQTTMAPYHNHDLSKVLYFWCKPITRHTAIKNVWRR
jgi:hypothetical protein